MVLRALQAGLTLADIDYVEYGELTDIIIEQANDHCDYNELATQADFDKF